MTDSSNSDQLSCLMDGELEARGARFLVRRIGGDTTLTAAWHRYHMVRAVLHGEPAVRANLAARVAAEIENETVQSAAGSRSLRWLRPVAGGAIAAAVAVVALVGLQNQPVPGGAEAPALTGSAENGEGFVSRENDVLNRPFTQQAVPVGLNPGQQQESPRSRLNSYLLRHNQMAGSAGAAGFVSYVPIVTSRPRQETAVAGEAETGAGAMERDESGRD